jgi:hypothetical protein
LGFKALSVFGRASKSATPLVNTHIDIMDWHGPRGGRPHSEIVAELVKELDRRYANGDEPIGIMTHHLVHDATAWDFVETLFAVLSESRAARWHALDDLIG